MKSRAVAMWENRHEFEDISRGTGNGIRGKMIVVGVATSMEGPPLQLPPDNRRIKVWYSRTSINPGGTLAFCANASVNR
jgi:hypothetical protein